MEVQGQRFFLTLLLLCGLCSHLCYSHPNQDQEHADVGFSETETTTSLRSKLDGRPTVLRDLHGYVGVGCCESNNHSSNITPSPINYWRVLCPSRYEIFVVLMGMHIAPKSYLQVKTTQFEGCTDKFFTRHFHKKSVVTGLVSNSAVLSAFKMAYVCVAKDKHMLASDTLENRAVLDYFATKEDSLELFLQFLNRPEMILTHGVELGKILKLSEEDQTTNQGGDTETGSSGEGNMTNGDSD